LKWHEVFVKFNDMADVHSLHRLKMTVSLIIYTLICFLNDSLSKTIKSVGLAVIIVAVLKES